MNYWKDLTTFYVQYGAKEIRRDVGGMKFDTGVYYTFKVDYPLGFPSNETGERYTVSVEVTENGKEIEYNVDGSVFSLYPKSPDVSKSFEIAKSDNSFTFRIPEETTLAGILTKSDTYKDRTITDVSDVDLTVKDYFALTVKSYDGSKIIRIGFGFV